MNGLLNPTTCTVHSCGGGGGGGAGGLGACALQRYCDHVSGSGHAAPDPGSGHAIVDPGSDHAIMDPGPGSDHVIMDPGSWTCLCDHGSRIRSCSPGPWTPVMWFRLYLEAGVMTDDEVVLSS